MERMMIQKITPTSSVGTIEKIAFTQKLSIAPPEYVAFAARGCHGILPRSGRATLRKQAGDAPSAASACFRVRMTPAACFRDVARMPPSPSESTLAQRSRREEVRMLARRRRLLCTARHPADAIHRFRPAPVAASRPRQAGLMARALADDMQQLGGLARRRQLQQLGHSARSIRAEIESRALRVVARSWVATAAARADAVRAVELRGTLGGASALASYGVWVPHEVPLCVATPHSASRLPPMRDTEWRLRIPGAGPAKTLGPRSPQWRVSLVDALLQHARCCLSDDQIVASFDSALHSGAVSRQWLLTIGPGMPRRVRRLVRHVDARAESGLESLLRLAFEREGWSVELQVRIDGVGRVDLVINGWLVIEADGKAWHDDPRSAQRDRLRNSALVLRGFRWHRFGYEQVMFDLDGCVAVVRALLASGRPQLSA
nr:hypothetical protein [Leifsonia sp. Root4]